MYCEGISRYCEEICWSDNLSRDYILRSLFIVLNDCNLGCRNHTCLSCYDTMISI